MNLNLANNSRLRLGTLCVLYASQGIPDGFVRVGLKTYLIQHGVSVADIGRLIALVTWPWAIKWLWGPIIDRFSHSSYGRRRPWILSAHFLMGATMASMMFVPDLAADLRLLGGLILLINFCSSLQDVAIDALAIDVLSDQERGMANGMMFASTYVGSFVGGALIGGLLLKYGIREAIILEMAVLAVIAAFPLLIRERESDRLFPGRPTTSVADESPVSGSMKRIVRDLGIAFRQRDSLLAALLAACALASSGSFLVFWPVYMQRQLGWSAENYLMLESTYAVLFGLGGSLLGGVVASWAGPKRSTLLAIFLLMACWLAFSLTFSHWQNERLVTCLFLAVVTLAGFFQVSMFAMFMGICSPAVAATQFSAYMALLNFSNSWGAIAAGTLSDSLSMLQIFLTLAGFQLLLVAIVLPIPPSTQATVEYPV